MESERLCSVDSVNKSDHRRERVDKNNGFKERTLASKNDVVFSDTIKNIRWRV